MCSSTVFSLLTSSSLMKKPQDDHIKRWGEILNLNEWNLEIFIIIFRPMNAFMVSFKHVTKILLKYPGIIESSYVKL